MKTTNLTAIAIASIFLAACGGGGDTSPAPSKPSTPSTPSTPSAPTDSTPVAGYYPLVASTAAYGDARARAFDSLNHYRTSCGFNAIAQDSNLDTAAQGHALYVSNNSTVSHTQSAGLPGFTGADAYTRITNTGFPIQAYMEMVGAGITNSGAIATTGILTETLNHTDIEILMKRQLASVYHHMGAFAEMQYGGMGYLQSMNNALAPTISYFDGFTILLADRSDGDTLDITTNKGVRTFPCNGTTGVLPVFSPETPNPMARSTTDQQANPYGHPIYVASDVGTTLAISSYTVSVNGSPVASVLINKDNDLNARLAAHQAYVIPEFELPANEAVSVNVTGTVDGTTPFTKSFTFKTGTQL